MALAFFTGGTQTALAAGTASGTTISNTATVEYEVATTLRSATGSVDFLVDNRVDMLVTGGSAINVAPGSTGQVLVFTVDNDGNTAQGYQFTVEAPGTPVMTQPVSVYIDDPDSGTVGSLDAGDPQYLVGTTGNFASLFGAEFGGGVGLDHDNGTGLTQVTVFIVADTPATAVDGTSDTYHLIATTLDASTNTVTSATGAPTGSLVTPDVVFADGTGTHTGAADNNGIHSASGTYTVATPQLTVAKTTANVSDEFNATGGFEIPGAVVRYSIVVDNTGGTATDANSVVISDPIPANTYLCVQAGTRCAAADVPSLDVDTSGLTAAAIEYSDDNGATWTYTPIPANINAEGADTTVTNIRYQPTGAMNAGPAGSSFNVTFGVLVQ